MALNAAELWQRASHTRAKALLDEANRGAAARLVLVAKLRAVGVVVTLVEVHTWPRELQGAAYLWAHDFANGLEDVPPPWTDTPFDPERRRR